MHSSIADIFIVWAKCEDGKIRGFIVDKADNADKLSTPEINGRFSLRTCPIGMIIMDDVVVPEGNLLPNVQGLKVESFANRSLYCNASLTNPYESAVKH